MPRFRENENTWSHVHRVQAARRVLIPFIGRTIGAEVPDDILEALQTCGLRLGCTAGWAGLHSG